MTELQFGLIGLGAVAIVGVVVYNTWQEYQYRKQAQQLLNIDHADVLLDGTDSGNHATSVASDFARTGVLEQSDEVNPSEQVSDLPSERQNAAAGGAAGSDLHERIEPVMRQDDAPENATAEGVEPVLSVPESPDMSPVMRSEVAKDARKTAEPLQLLSSSIDYVASIEAIEPAPAFQILDARREVMSRVRKPVHWLGLNEISNEWEIISSEMKNDYRRFRIGLQLADRQGPLGEKDLAIFFMAMQELSDELMAIPELPPRQPAIDAAVELDAFCASVDIQIGINVISNGVVFQGTKIRALAEAAGMVIDADGRFVRCDDDGNVLFVLINQEAAGFPVESMKTLTTNGITFLLDVPRVSHGERIFNQMVDLARRFSEVLRGALVDDNRRPLSEEALEPIRRQIIQYQSLMAARNLPAGGSLAQRLFS